MWVLFLENSYFYPSDYTVVGSNTRTAPLIDPVDPEIGLICLSSVKSFAEFEFCAKKAISGRYGLENSQKFLKKPRISKNLKIC